MNVIPETFRATIWFALCVTMVVGMVTLAVIMAFFSILSKAFSWKEISYPNIKIAK